MLYQMNVLDRPQHPAEQDALLKVIDPHNNKRMTFSEVTHLFLSHMVDSNGQQVPLLEKYININGVENTLNLDMTEAELAGHPYNPDESVDTEQI
jgi:hypothetical protein